MYVTQRLLLKLLVIAYLTLVRFKLETIKLIAYITATSNILAPDLYLTETGSTSKYDILAQISDAVCNVHVSKLRLRLNHREKINMLFQAHIMGLLTTVVRANTKRKL